MWPVLFAGVVFFPASSVLAEVRVVATLPVLADIAREVGGSHVTVRALAKGTEDPHYVIPRPSLMAAVSEADLFVEIGLQLELWTERLLEGAGNSHVLPGRPGHVYAFVGARLLELPDRLTRADGDIHPGGNPHIWLNPENVIVMAENIVDGLKRVDPEHAEDYDSQLSRYASKIRGKMDEWTRRAAPLSGLTFVSYHREFAYLGEFLGIREIATIEEKPGIPPSAGHRDRLLKLMSREGIRLIVRTNFEPPQITDRMATMSGASVVVVPLNVDGDPAAKDYASFFDLMLDKLLSAAGSVTADD